MTPTPAIERIEASPPSVASRSAFEWSCLLRHDGDYDQETRDAIHAHNERIIQQAMDGKLEEAAMICDAQAEGRPTTCKWEQTTETLAKRIRALAEQPKGGS